MTTASASTQGRPLRSALLLLASAWIVTEALSALSECIINGAADGTPVPVVAAFSGKFESGAPVYRLPPVTVTAERSAATLQTLVPNRGPVEARASRSRARSPS
jgi:hypothetical protein